MKPILKHAIAIEGARIRLAEVLRVKPSTVHYWETVRLPRRREEQLVRLYGRRKPKKEWTPKP